MNSTTFKAVHALRARGTPVYSYVIWRDVGEEAQYRLPNLSSNGTISRMKDAITGQSRYFVTDEQYAAYMRGKKVTYLKKLQRTIGSDPFLTAIIDDYKAAA